MGMKRLAFWLGEKMRMWAAKAMVEQRFGAAGLWAGLSNRLVNWGKE